MKEKIQNKISLFINNAISMFHWIKNKKQIEEEHRKEDEQYNRRCTEISELNKEIVKLKQQLENTNKLKTIYLGRCKNLKRKLVECENKNA